MKLKPEYLNKLICADSTIEMGKLPENSVSLVITDPPYNASGKGINLPNNTTGGAYYKVNEDWDKFGHFSNYLEFTKTWIKEADRILKPSGSILVCCSLHNISEVIITLKELNYKQLNIIIWKKTNPMPNITKRMLTHSTEFIVWFAKGKGWTFNYDQMKKYNENKQLRDVWEFPLCQGKERIKGENNRAAHPTQKPLKLFSRLIEMASNEGDIVIDPFIGIGTTALAAINLKRDWIGYDSNKTYLDLAKERINEFENKN